jgi:uncharacterized protein
MFDLATDARTKQYVRRGGDVAMARFLLEARIDPAKLDVLAAKRAEHYAFLVAHQAEIVFGGPSRGRDGGPHETMIMVVEAASQADAQVFMDREPYHRNGGFSTVTVRSYTQVMPEPEPGSLLRALEAERARIALALTRGGAKLPRRGRPRS